MARMSNNGRHRRQRKGWDAKKPAITINEMK
jgi:hypothetical protein